MLRDYASLLDDEPLLLEERKAPLSEIREMLERARLEGPRNTDSERAYRMKVLCDLKSAGLVAQAELDL